MSKTALITGLIGQVGFYLAEFLEKGFVDFGRYLNCVPVHKDAVFFIEPRIIYVVGQTWLQKFTRAVI